MHAIEVSTPGGANNLTYVSADIPQPDAGQVVVRTHAAGVNFIDTYIRSGVYSTDFPWRPGTEGSGVVTEVGEDVQGLAVGDRIAWATSVTGSYAQYVVVEADQALPIPEGMDMDTAAALPLQGLTVHMLTHGVTSLNEESTVFITGGAGGVGQLFIQYAKHLGARVLTMVGSHQKSKIALAAGANRVFIQEDFTDTTAELSTLLKDLTEGQGVDVFYDGVGKDTFDAAIASVRPRGLVVLFGGASGQVPPFDLQRLNAAGSLFVTRPTVWHYIADPSERAQRWHEITTAVLEGAVQVSIGATYELADAQQAHEALESRGTTGKVLLVP